MLHLLKYILLLSISLHVLKLKAFSKSLLPLHEDSKKTSEALGLILNSGSEKLHKFDLFVATAYDESKTYNSHLFSDLLNSILSGLKDLRAINIKYQTEINFKAHPHFQLILVDNFKSLSYLYGNLINKGTSNLSYNLICFSSVTTPNDPQINDTFALLWKLHALNVAFIAPATLSARDDLVMLTYFPFEFNYCEVNRPQLINSFNFNNKTWQHQNYFPEKLRNFNGCPIVGATREAMPYLQAIRARNGKIIDYIGIEGRLLTFIAKNLNYTLVSYMLSEEEIRATSNETGWIFEQLFRKNVKYALGAFLHKPDLEDRSPFSQTKYYFVSNIYLVVNNVYQHTRFAMLLRPLQFHVWLMIGLVFGLGYAIIFALGCGFRRGYIFIIGQTSSTPYYNMFVTCVGGQIANPLLPSRNFARYLLMHWLLLTLVLRGAFQSGLFEILRYQRVEEPPQTLNEVAAQNDVIEMIPENVRFLTSLPEVKHVRYLNRTNELQAFPALATAAERTAILTRYEYFGHFRKMNQSISRHLSLVRERIFAQPLSFYVQRNSFLVPLLDEQIARARNYGFIDIWKKQHMAERLESELGNGRATARLTVKYAFEAPTTNADVHVDDAAQHTHAKLNILSLDELDAIFRVCAYLLLFAGGIFIGELVYAKLKMTTFK